MRLPDPSEQPTIRVDECAAFLGVSRAAMYRSIERGEVDVLRIGQHRISVLVAPLRRKLGLDPPVTKE